MPASPSTAVPAAIGERELIAMMAMLMALQALCIDSMLPALGRIAQDLSVSDPNKRQLVVGVFLISAGLGSLFPGAIADRFGRRPVLFVCLALYVALGAACALVQDFTALLVLRALQGVATAGLSVLPSAIIRDQISGDKMARMMSMIGMVFMVVPMIAPSFGQAVMLIAGWRWIFGGMAIGGLVMAAWVYLRLPETLHPEFRQSINPRAIAANMGEAITNRAAFGYVFGSALLTGGILGYINSAQQLVAEHFGAGTRFPLIFAGMAGCMAAANFFNSRIVERFGARRVSHFALFGFIAIALLQVWQASQPGETLWQFIPLMTANFCLLGFLGANFGAIALQPFARIAGAAASLQAFVRMALGSLLGILVGQAFDGSALPLTLSLLGFGSLALGLVLFSERGKLFRRLNPPGAPRLVPNPELH